MRFNKGDKVRIKNDLKHCHSKLGINQCMYQYSGMIATIVSKEEGNHFFYRLNIDQSNWAWDDNLVTDPYYGIFIPLLRFI